jgi:hypothetical protein
MILAFVAVVFAALKLTDKKQAMVYPTVTIIQRFNLIERFRFLFQKSQFLKHLLIISTIFTFSVDIFYEFGPVYLTGLWGMTPAGIAIYNAILSFTLAIGSGWLPHYFSLRISTERVVATAMFITAIMFGILFIFPSLISAFILFGLVGLCIALANTNLTIQISNAVDVFIQGEALGTQLSLRMLGDAIICLIGGILIVTSVKLPIALSSCIAMGALVVYAATFLNKPRNKRIFRSSF